MLITKLFKVGKDNRQETETEKSSYWRQWRIRYARISGEHDSYTNGQTGPILSPRKIDLHNNQVITENMNCGFPF